MQAHNWVTDCHFGKSAEVAINFTNIVDRHFGRFEKLLLEVQLIQIACDRGPVGQLLLLEMVNCRHASKLDALVFLIEHNEPLVHLVEEVQILAE